MRTVVKVYDIVKDILQRVPETRNSDQKLMYFVWKRQGFCNSDNYGVRFNNVECFLEAAHPKSIIESRRQLQRDQEEKIRNGNDIPDSELVIANKEVLALRESRNAQKGTHIFRDQVSLFK